MTNEELQKRIRAERDFLHALANQLLIVHGMGTIVKSKLEKNPDQGEVVLDKVEKQLVAAEKLTALIKERRSLLISEGESLT